MLGTLHTDQLMYIGYCMYSNTEAQFNVVLNFSVSFPSSRWIGYSKLSLGVKVSKNVSVHSTLQSTGAISVEFLYLPGMGSVSLHRHPDQKKQKKGMNEQML